jgi:hypothetical protein
MNIQVDSKPGTTHPDKVIVVFLTPSRKMLETIARSFYIPLNTSFTVILPYHFILHISAADMMS